VKRLATLFLLCASGCTAIVEEGETFSLDDDILVEEVSAERTVYLNGAPQVLYLNFEGVTLRPGSDDPAANRSYYVLEDTAVPPFSHSRFWFQMPKSRMQAISTIARGVQALFSAFNVQVVVSRPASGPYTMVVVGGEAGDSFVQPGLGLAPLDCGNGNPSNVAMVWTDSIPAWAGFPTAIITMTIAHEAAHTFGLHHIPPWNAIMAPRGSDVTAPLAGWRKGTVETNYCNLPGGAQDDAALLNQNVGPAAVGP
jgi:hypothetical protein